MEEQQEITKEGFYKKDGEEILYAPNYVEGQGFTLIIDNKDTYDYPIDGWIYADNSDIANTTLNQK